MTFDGSQMSLDCEIIASQAELRFDGNAPVISSRSAHPLAVLAQLGNVVCLHREAHLFALQRDVLDVLPGTRAVLRCDIDMHGPLEALCFVDGSGHSCLQVGLLPDSDFLAWERLQGLWQAGLLQAPSVQGERIGVALPRPRRWWGSRRWMSTVCRFELDGDGNLRLTPVALSSACSARAAAHWAARAHVGGMALDSHCHCPRSRLFNLA